MITPRILVRPLLSLKSVGLPQETLDRRKPVQVNGKGTKMWWSEKAVRSYLRKFTNRCGGSNVVFNAH
jgi:hypothetical protein